VRRCIRWIILATLLFPVPAPSQLALEAAITGVIDDNIDNNALGVGDRITIGALSAGYDFPLGSAGAQVYYLTSLKYFTTITERTYQSHTAGATFAVSLDQEDRTILNAGASYDVRTGRGAYAFYDSRMVSGVTTLKRYLSNSVMGRAGYSVRRAGFPGLELFDYAEHYGFIQATASFPPGSTVILQADLGAKYYTTAAGETVTSPAGATQSVMLARVGQALREGTGLSVTGSFRFNLRKESRYLGMEYGPVSDDEIFDDHYGYEGPHAEATVTQILSPGTIVRLSGLIQRRDYTNRPAYDSDWNVISGRREDRRWVVTLNLEKDLDEAGVSLGLEYDYAINHSNDAFYSYSNNTISILFSLAR
jgi:hypothetical protein